MKNLVVDIAIVGSGFGGTLTALIAQQLGFRVAVCDIGTHPRFAIGESSTPLADRLLKSLAERYSLPMLMPLTQYGSWKQSYPQLNVGRKRGFSYLRHRPMQAFDAREDDLLMVAASSSNEASDTHWYRADLDAWLAKKCSSAGIPVFEDFDAVPSESAEGRWLLTDRLRSVDPRNPAYVRSVEAELVIDASGAAAVVARAAGVGRVDVNEFLTHSAAVFGHWKGLPPVASFDGLGNVDDHPFAIDDSAVHHLFEDGWMWQLRFDDDRVSMGVCFDKEDEVTPEWLARVAFNYPTIAMQIAHSAGMPENVTSTKRLQRRIAQVAGRNWVALPHTIGFVDPMHSTGIALTLGGVSKLSLVLERWSVGRPAPVDDWGMSPVVSEIQRIDRLVALAYRTRSEPRAFEAAVLLYTAAAIASETSADEPCELFVDRNHVLDQLADECWTAVSRGPMSAALGERLIETIRSRAASIGIDAIAEPVHRGRYSATATRE